jgi:hypothetical protein
MSSSQHDISVQADFSLKLPAVNFYAGERDKALRFQEFIDLSLADLSPGTR